MFLSTGLNFWKLKLLFLEDYHITRWIHFNIFNHDENNWFFLHLYLIKSVSRLKTERDKERIMIQCFTCRLVLSQLSHQAIHNLLGHSSPPFYLPAYQLCKEYFWKGFWAFVLTKNIQDLVGCLWDVVLKASNSKPSHDSSASALFFTFISSAFRAWCCTVECNLIVIS